MAHVRSVLLPRVLHNSIWMIVGGGFIAAIIGISTAWLTTRYRFVGSHVMRWMLWLPLSVPCYITAFMYAGWLEYAGPVQGWLRMISPDITLPEIRSVGGAIFVFSVTLYPYVYVVVSMALRRLHHTMAIGSSLGLSGARLLRMIAIPAIWPAIVAGISLVIMEIIADFGTVDYLGVDSLTTIIYRSWFEMQNALVANKIASILILVVFTVVLIEKYASRRASYYALDVGVAPYQPVMLRGWKNAAAFICCALPILLGWVVPISLILWQHFVHSQAVWSDYASTIKMSIWLALLAGLITLAIAVCLSMIARFKAGRGMRNLIRITTLGYAIPGSVLAVGLLVSLGWVDHRINDVTKMMWGSTPGLLLSGSMAALIIAYVWRFLAIAMHNIEPHLQQMHNALYWQVRLLRLSFIARWRTVYLPFLNRPMMIAGLLVMVEVIKELPATLIIRPFDVETLASYAYELASDERLADAASPALWIMILAVIPVLILHYLTAQLGDPPTDKLRSY